MGKEARSCIDKNYITGITKAFNEMAECFGFNKDKDKKRLFAKFHVESRLLLRKVEDRPDIGTKPSTNRCFGQLKNSVIETLNQYIHFGDIEREKNFKEKEEPYKSSWFKYGDIYKNALNKCPFLSNLLTPDSSLLKGTSLNKPSPQEDSTFEKIHKKEASSIICKTSQDPYSCLFYSMYNARRNLLDISEQLEKIKKSKNYEISFYIDGAPLFKNEDDLKWSFAIWAHNGGNGIIRRRFSEFIENLKDSIDDPYDACKKQGLCENHSSSKCKKCIGKYKKYKTSLSGGKSLTTPILHREFAIFAKEINIKNAQEVSDFMNKIKTQIPALSSTGSIRSALDYFHKKKTCDDEKVCGDDKECDEKAYDDGKMKQLIESTQKHCPISINQIFDYK